MVAQRARSDCEADVGRQSAMKPAGSACERTSIGALMSDLEPAGKKPSRRINGACAATLTRQTI